MPECQAIRRSIYAQLWREATSIEAPPRESAPHGAPQLELRRLEHPTAALARLAEPYLEAQLLAAGVGVRDAEGELVPSPALRDSGAELLALFDRPGEPPRDLLTATGCLSGASVVIATRQDYRVRASWDGANGYVYLAFRLVDFARLAGAGIATLYCPGALRLDVSFARQLAAELAEICDERAADANNGEETAGEPCCGASELHPTSPGDSGAPDDSCAPDDSLDAASQASVAAPGANSPAAADAPAPEISACAGTASPPAGQAAWRLPAVVLVAWSPAEWAPGEAPGLTESIRALGRVEQALGAACLGLELIVWAPTRGELAALDLVSQYGEAEQLQRAFAESVEATGRTLAAALVEPPPQNFLEARAAYRRALLDAGLGQCDVLELSAAQSQYEQHLQRQFVEPLFRCGEDSPDPRERARCAAAAEVCDQFYRLAPLVAVELNSSAARYESFAGSVSHGSGLQAFLNLAKTLAKFVERRQ